MPVHVLPAWRCRAAVTVAVIATTCLIAPFAGSSVFAAEAAQAKVSAPDVSGGSSSWIFDQGTYSNSPKTGQRVDQYAKPDPSYRNPNSWFESPGPSILDGTWQQYDYSKLYPYGANPYYLYQWGHDGTIPTMGVNPSLYPYSHPDPLPSE